MKKLPKMNSDKEVEEFLKKDLSDYINKYNFKQTTFEFSPKDKHITLRVSDILLSTLQSAAQQQDIPYQRLIRMAIEEYLKNFGNQRSLYKGKTAIKSVPQASSRVAIGNRKSISPKIKGTRKEKVLS